MNITCRKTKCKYNENYSCTSKNIFVQKNLNCAYYDPVEKTALQDVSKSMFEIAPEIAPFKDKKDVHIFCEADCIFNKYNKCVSNGIFVNGETPVLNEKKDEEILPPDRYQAKHKSKPKTMKKIFKNKTFEIQEQHPQHSCKNCGKCNHSKGEATCFSFVKK